MLVNITILEIKIMKNDLSIDKIQVITVGSGHLSRVKDKAKRELKREVNAKNPSYNKSFRESDSESEAEIFK